MVIYDSTYNGFYNITNNGKTKIRLNENAFTFILNEDEKTYTITPIEGYISSEEKKQMLINEIQELKIFEGTTEADTEILRCKQEFSDLCNGIPVITKTEIESQLTDANKDRDYYFDMLLEDGGMWG